MKRDFDLVRALLRELEALPAEPRSSIAMPHVEGFTEAEVGYHAYIMNQAGLVEVANFRPIDRSAQFAIPVALTWAGHEFLSAAADDTLWSRAKTHVIGPAGKVAFSVLLEWLKQESSRLLR